jgi:hypothetical protein
MKRRISEDMHVNVHEILPPSGRLDDNYQPSKLNNHGQARNLEENHPHRHHYPDGHRHHFWSNIVHVASVAAGHPSKNATRNPQLSRFSKYGNPSASGCRVFVF